MTKTEKIAASLAAAAVVGFAGHTAYEYATRQIPAVSGTQAETAGPTAQSTYRPTYTTPSETAETTPEASPTPSFIPTPLPAAARAVGAMCWASFTVPTTRLDLQVSGGTSTDVGYIQLGTTWKPMKNPQTILTGIKGGTPVVVAQDCSSGKVSLGIAAKDSPSDILPMPLMIEPEDFPAPANGSIVVDGTGSSLENRDIHYLPNGIGVPSKGAASMTWGSTGCDPKSFSVFSWLDSTGKLHYTKDMSKSFPMGSTVTFTDGSKITVRSCNTQDPTKK